MKKVLVAAAIGAMLAACGSATSQGSVPTPTPSAPAIPSTGPGINFDVIVTEKDHSANLHVGQRLLVVLHAGANMRPWSHPTSSDTGVLTPTVDPAAAAPIGVSVAAFQAHGPGVVTVTAVSGPGCESGQPCPMYAILYSLQVTIAD